MADPPPPSYDSVVTGTWHQENVIPPSNHPPPYLPYAPPISPTSQTSQISLSHVGFDNGSGHSPNNIPLMTAAPPAYNPGYTESSRDISPTLTVDTQQPSTEVTSTNDDSGGDKCSCKFYLLLAVF